MGIEGADIATLLSQTLAVILTIIHFYRRAEEPKLHFTISIFGVDAIAAFTAYFKIELILYLPIIVLGQALVSFVGQNYGASQYDRINKGVRYSMIVSIIITMLFLKS